MSTQSPSPDIRDWEARAVDALEDARAMPRGPGRNDALKKAGQLRVSVDMKRHRQSIGWLACEPKTG